MKVLQLHNASRSGLPSGESVVFLNEALRAGNAWRERSQS